MNLYIQKSSTWTPSIFFVFRVRFRCSGRFLAIPPSKIAEKSMISTIACKEAVNISYETTLSQGLLFERRAFHALFNTEDQKEGMGAFMEKRSAQFRDR